MAVIMASPTRSSAALVNYVLADKKDQRGERYVMASGVGGLLVSVADKQMRDVRKKFNKDKAGAYVQAYHVIESFGKDELLPDSPDSWLTAQKLGRALAEDRFPGRQVLVVTQRDGKTGCIHNHLVINSIETKTGKSLNSSIVMHSRLVEAHERVLESEGFEQRADLKQAFSDATERRERGEPSGMRRAHSVQHSELREFQRHIQWEVNNEIADEFGFPHDPEPFSATVLKHCIGRALTDPAATDWASFVEAGRTYGVRIEQRGKKGRGISYGMLREQPDGTLAEPSSSARRRCATLGADFEMDAVEEALARNGALVQAQALLVPVIATVSPSVPPTPQHKPAARMTSMNERMLAALEEVGKQAEANTQRMIADYIMDKTSATAVQKPAVTPPQSAEQLPDTPSPSNTGEADEAQEVAQSTLWVSGAGDATTTVLAAPDAPDDSDNSDNSDNSDKLRKINARSRRLGLPPVSAAQHAERKALTPEQRKRRLERAAWFDDATPATALSKHGPELGD
ncbi:relaxase/mobilization nuclease domain-containing protein [Microterricola viridarii]|uniref:Relaxase/Mobilisation nuclease domain-containing protein n=1 Tax=Microterricola viridarii TaxID=412690 RepID=A0A1H1T5I1_9MICO|nr:relaxase/mobilization nuclease domain-containing protein [Microterricola viridarii]SDS55414.1 Relaxase/Mobilisation nuclease domain-containing protein [Microterricola viridarii]